jgi:hypothetical protein
LLAAGWLLAPGAPAVGSPAAPTVSGPGPSRWLAAPIAQAGGIARAVAVSGDRAYLGVGPRVLALDVGDPAAPRLLGQTEVLPGVVQDLAVAGDIVYAITGYGWSGGAMVALDMRGHPAPWVVGQLHLPAPVALAIYGQRALVAGGGLHIIDISNPGQLVEVAASGETPGALGIAVEGDFGYGFGGGQVYSLNLVGPGALRMSSKQSVAGAVSGIALSGGHAFAVGDAGLTVLDVSDPLDIHGLTLTALGIGAHSIVAADDTAYVAYGNRMGDRVAPQRATGGLMALDIRDPRRPTVRGVWDAGASVYDVVLVGHLAYLALPEDGLQVVDVAAPERPRLLGSFATAGVFTALDADGAQVVATGISHGLTAFTLDADHSLHQTGRLDTGGGAEDVALSDGRAHLALGATGLLVADLTSGGELTLRGTATSQGRAMAVAASDGHAYVADRNGALVSYRVPDVGPPIRIAINPAARSANAVALGAGYAFVLSDEYRPGDTPATLRAFDIGDPENPKLAGTQPVSYTEGLALAGHHAFVWGVGFDDLVRLDVSNHLLAPPPALQFSGVERLSAVHPMPGSEAVLLSSYDVALASVDVAQSVGSHAMRLFGTGMPGADIDVVGDIAYVAALDSGVWVVSLTARAPWQAMLPLVTR